MAVIDIRFCGCCRFGNPFIANLIAALLIELQQASVALNKVTIDRCRQHDTAKSKLKRSRDLTERKEVVKKAT